MNYLSYYFIVINILAFLLMQADKSAARRKKKRIPEQNLFIIALVGGSLGITMGMYVFRHKTRKLSFQLGIPMIILLQYFVFSFYKI